MTRIITRHISPYHAIQGDDGDSMSAQLKDHIAAVLEGLRHMDPDSAADLIAEIADEIAGGDDLFNGAILDGIRWGHHAAVAVETRGGAMLRVVYPGGVGITHEWASGAEAKPQIDAALTAAAFVRAGEKLRAITDRTGE